MSQDALAPAPRRTSPAWIWMLVAGVLFAGIVVGFFARGLLGERPIARGYLSTLSLAHRSHNFNVYNVEERPYGIVYREALIVEGRGGGRSIYPLNYVMEIGLDEPIVVMPEQLRIERDEAGSTRGEVAPDEAGSVP